VDRTNAQPERRLDVSLGTGLATTYEEKMTYFAGDRETLFGILTSPTREPTGTWIALLPGGSGTLDSMNRNRLWVRLARRLGSLGCFAFRFDYHGAGESTGTAESLRLDRPFTEDLEGALSWMQEQGAQNVVLIGSCFGAQTALAGGAEVPGLRGLVLVAPYMRNLTHGEAVAERMASEWPLRRYLRRVLRIRTVSALLNPERRRVYRTVLKARIRALGSTTAASNDESDRVFLGPFNRVVDRRIPTLLIFGDEEDPTRVEFEQAKDGELGEILHRAGDLVEVRLLPGKVHGLRSLVVQDSVIELVTDWLNRQDLARRDE
jgi:pimeloyl-ACP methyl ester carboxylesterase